MSYEVVAKLTAAQRALLESIGDGAWVPSFHDALASGFAPSRWGADSVTAMHAQGLLVEAAPRASGYAYVALTDAGRAALAEVRS